MEQTRGRRAGSAWPWWVWLIIVGLGLTQPLVHVWIAHFPPRGTAPTGMAIPDSSQFLYAMRMFPTDFASHYATCQSPHGEHYVGYFPFTFLWLYGVLGYVTHLLGLDPFLSYGVAGGCCVSLYLAAVYGFLRAALPGLANRAFALFALSGGLGGALYIVTGLFGLHDAPRFDAYFLRYAMYELMEGPHLLPVTCFPRMYYTFALALGFTAFTMLIAVCNGRLKPGWLALAAGLMLVGALPNLRCGVFIFGAMVLYLWRRGDLPVRLRVCAALVFVPPLAVAAYTTRALLATSPQLVSNLVDVANMAMWFSPFLSAAALHLCLAPRAVATRLAGLSPFTKTCAWAAIGYLAAFAPLFLAYQFYYGNLWACRDAAVAETISDFALIGAAAGAAWGFRQRRRQAGGDPLDWVVLWLLAYLPVSLSAWGQGWFLRFGPHRLQVLLWLPLCILSAAALDAMARRRPWRAVAWQTALYACGACSIAVAAACFQGPLGRAHAQGPYPQQHVEIMTLADAAALDALGPGRVLAMRPAGDAVVFRAGNRVVYGIGSFNLAEQPEVLLRAETEAFFAPETSDAERRRIAATWCADYVFCSDTWPVPEATVAALRQTPWLEAVFEQDGAVVFRVVE